ncbi:MAG: hypothetical protein AMS18_14870 [Gemmatimonas sp. SG8_17]|nr:MAG: hypothetical protein AMS18_14870 [Gemmatimonas sp. SG8_17]
MAPFTTRWLLYLHTLVTAETLAMVCTVQSWLEEIGLVERFVMTVLTAWWLRTDGAVMVATLADNVFMTVEMRSYLALADVLHQLVHDLAVRKFDRFVLFREDADGDGVWDVAACERETDFSLRRLELGKRCIATLDRFDQVRSRTGVTDIAGVFREPALFHQRVAPGAGYLVLLLVMAADAAMLGARVMHRLLQGDAATLLAPTEGVTLGTRGHALMMAGAARLVEVLVSYVREGHRTDGT